MKLALIYDLAREDATGGYFLRAFRALGVAADHYWLRDADRIPAGYDLYLRIDQGDGYLTRLPERLRPAAFYAMETHLPHPWRKIRRSAGWYDLVFCYLMDAVRRLPGSVWLPAACDPSVTPGPSGEPVWDVAFVGTEGGVPRKFYLQALRERYPRSRIGHVPHTELGAVYGRSKIGFNYSITGDANMRICEILASGACLVTNAADSEDLRLMGLEDRRHLAFYRHPGELFEMIDHYLAHPDERRQLADAGSSLVRARHTYTHRAQTVLAAAAERLGIGTPMTMSGAVTCASS